MLRTKTGSEPDHPEKKHESRIELFDKTKPGTFFLPIFPFPCGLLFLLFLMKKKKILSVLYDAQFILWAKKLTVTVIYTYTERQAVVHNNWSAVKRKNNKNILSKCVEKICIKLIKTYFLHRNEYNNTMSMSHFRNH